MRLLKQLSEVIGVSGAEEEVRSLILGQIDGHADDVKIDNLGNVLALKRGTGRNRLRVLVAAHMDEVGFMVTGYNSNGTLKMAAVGGLDPRILLGKRVLVGPDRLPGVIGAKPTHLLTATDRDKVVQIKSMRIDIGTTTRDKAKAKVELGTRAGFDTPFANLGATARGKAFDDRVGCAVLVKLLRGEPFSFDLHALFSVQEEVGLRGAGVAAHAIDPDAAFVLEGTIADDLPKEDDVSPTTELGKGPALSVMDRSTIYDKRLNKLLADTAQELGIAHQYKQPGLGGTDAGSIHRARSGVPTAAVSVPCRYIHSPAAILNKRDYRNTEKLVRESLMRLSRRTLAG
jgi:putative aminopeptidase FrvX